MSRRLEPWAHLQSTQGGPTPDELSSALGELAHLRAALLELCAAHGVRLEGDAAHALHAMLDEVMAAVATTGARRAVAFEARERERLDQAMRLLPVGVFVADADGRMLLINDAARRTWGPDVPFAESAASYDLYRGYPPGSTEPFAAEDWALARALRGEATADHEFEMISPTGDRRTLLNWARALRGPDGAVTGGVAVNVDITDRKQAERERAREAEFRERFLGILGHDLRTPLSAITFSAQSLLTPAFPDDARIRGLQRIVRSADRMARMIRDLLDFTRARQGGGIPVTLLPGDLGAICRQVVDEVRLTHADRIVALHAAGATGGRWDHDRIAQVVQNLVVNALQHSPAHTPVGVSVDGAGDRVLLVVANEGPPIPPELLADLWNPFRRGVSAEGARPSEGLGLGLYIAHEIVSAHQGRIDVESDEARGTTFRVELPRGL